MPLFLSEEEFRALSHDAGAVVERADAAIYDLRRQLDTVRAEADAAAIASEQTCAILEQRYDVLSADLDRLRFENAQLVASSEKHVSALAEVQAEKHQLHLKAVSMLPPLPCPSSLSFSMLCIRSYEKLSCRLQPVLLPPNPWDPSSK